MSPQSDADRSRAYRERKAKGETAKRGRPVTAACGTYSSARRNEQLVDAGEACGPGGASICDECKAAKSAYLAEQYERRKARLASQSKPKGTK